MNHSNELQSSRIAPEIESASSGGNRRFAFSLHVAFEHEQKLLKLCFGFPLISRTLDVAFNIGGSLKLNEHINLLFTGGRDIVGDTKGMAYVGLQFLTK